MIPLSATRSFEPFEPTSQSFGDAQIEIEGGQIPSVDADETGAGGAGPFRFHLVVDLYQRLDSGLCRGGYQPGQHVILEGGDDQQDGIGADRPTLPDLRRVEYEVLAEHRDVHRRRGSSEIGDAPAEELRFGEDRDGRRTARLVRRGEDRRVEVRCQHAPRR